MRKVCLWGQCAGAEEGNLKTRAFMVKEALQSKMLTYIQTVVCDQECENTEFSPCSVLLFPVWYLP